MNQIDNKNYTWMYWKSKVHIVETICKIRFIRSNVIIFENMILILDNTSCMYVTLSVSRCIHYSYPEILDYPHVDGETGYIKIGDERYPIKLFDNQDILNFICF